MTVPRFTSLSSATRRLPCSILRGRCATFQYVKHSNENLHGRALVLTALTAWSAVQTMPAARAQRRAEAFADFRDLAAAAGLSARTIIGGETTKEYILETTGGGVAIVDYDNDGWADIFLVNGARLKARPSTRGRSLRAGRPMRHR